MVVWLLAGKVAEHGMILLWSMLFMLDALEAVLRTVGLSDVVFCLQIHIYLMDNQEFCEFL